MCYYYASMAENVPVADLLMFLRAHDIAALATVSETNAAHATTTYFYVEDDLNFYMLTKYETFKFKNLTKNHSVALVVTNEKSLETVQVEGIAKEVDYSHEYAPTVKRFTKNLEKNGWKWENIPLNHVFAGYYSFVQIKPTWIRWSDFRDWEHKVKFEQRF